MRLVMSSIVLFFVVRKFRFGTKCKYILYIRPSDYKPQTNLDHDDFQSYINCLFSMLFLFYSSSCSQQSPSSTQHGERRQHRNQEYLRKSFITPRENPRRRHF